MSEEEITRMFWRQIDYLVMSRSAIATSTWLHALNECNEEIERNYLGGILKSNLESWFFWRATFRFNSQARLLYKQFFCYDKHSTDNGSKHKTFFHIFISSIVDLRESLDDDDVYAIHVNRAACAITDFITQFHWTKSPRSHWNSDWIINLYGEISGVTRLINWRLSGRRLFTSQVK